MKKALCFFLAIVFVCCVITHGKNERFSLEAFLNNITNFEDMPTMEDIVSVWQEPYFVRPIDLPDWIDVYHREEIDGIIHSFYAGCFPKAYEANGKLTTRYSYVYLDVYNENGTYLGNIPIVQATEEWVFYEDPDAEGIEKFFNPVRGFIMRFGRTVDYVIELIKCVFANLKYLLPWNSTVPKGAI